MELANLLVERIDRPQVISSARVIELQVIRRIAGKDTFLFPVLCLGLLTCDDVVVIGDTKRFSAAIRYLKL